MGIYFNIYDCYQSKSESANNAGFVRICRMTVILYLCLWKKATSSSRRVSLESSSTFKLLVSNMVKRTQAFGMAIENGYMLQISNIAYRRSSVHWSQH